MKKYRDILLFAAAVVVLLFFIGNVCPLEHIIGVPCPGCNMFSALYWLFIKGDVVSAHYYHPAVWAFLLYIGITMLLFVRNKEKMVKTRGFRICTTLFLMVLLGVYIYRMFYIFPQAPMTLNEQAILLKLFHLF